ncbi:MAG: extracellular solute-binding protein [Rhodospirillales bacterium]|jgi:iron(III) transport system substrate-binding protein|nr:extracellular solute-binding protein [Rhodospirillales bacterium]MBT4007285.1 extracellular solute-binding protein [Rhodospirillales bacterium]MBT5077010.1 extracellular solute-binding protein [Rhodospirillales bacterium]MBT5113618.1 extracellular solute-binding protein [Rhodospirillales bacterium]MBT5673916.1 extracellular solute-binding protein [Rhodospirillales bacterium]
MFLKRANQMSLALLIAGGVACSPVVAAQLPAPTQALLEKLKLNPEILSGLDAELVVPKNWLANAKKEKPLKILGAWDPSQFRKLSAPFKLRYPDIPISYARGGRYDRGIKPLLALKSGRYLSDIIISPGGDWVRFKDINALEDLRVVPNYKFLSKDMREENGLWVGQKVAHRCMAYNTDKVKKSEMPKRWEDLVDDPRWRGGNLGIPNRPNLWLSMLWLKKGPDWVQSFMRKLFTVVKPQLRKEGANAMIGLTVAGEFHATVAAAAYRVKQYQDRGAPIAFHCPVPVPLAISIMMVLKDNPHKYSSLIFTNWFLSKEGQISQFGANSAVPVRADLANRKEFIPFPEEVAGKPIAIRDEGKLRLEYPKLVNMYTPMWQSAGGPVEKTGPAKTVSVVLTAVKRGGRIIYFMHKGKKKTAGISRRRTEVTLDGKNTSRKKFKPGMTCKVTYPGDGARAKKVACNSK